LGEDLAVFDGAGALGRAVVFLALAGFLLADQVVVVDEFVAIGHQQVAARVLDSHPDHELVILA